MLRRNIYSAIGSANSPTIETNTAENFHILFLWVNLYQNFASLQTKKAAPESTVQPFQVYVSELSVLDVRLFQTEAALAVNHLEQEAK